MTKAERRDERKRNKRKMVVRGKSLKDLVRIIGEKADAIRKSD